MAKYAKKKQAQKKAEKERRKTLSARQTYALENAHLRAVEGGSSPMNGKKSVSYNNTTDQLVGGKIKGTEVDAAFASDIQKMKFCRKPVGFVMWLLYLILLVVVAMPFVLSKVELDLGLDLNQYVALCMETEPQEADEEELEEGEENAEGEEEAASDAASVGRILSADEDATEVSDEELTEEDEEEEEESAVFDGTLYSLSDPLFGWIKFIASKFNLSLELGESPWYDTQVAKTEAGMSDTISSILILAFPPFIVIYVILTLVLMVQTFICFASGDRRIFRFTSIEDFFLLLSGAIIMLGAFATTTEVDGALDFSQIANFILGGVTGAGGFTAGYGMLIMLIVPVVAFVLSFFLLEKKLRGREITQPIVVYHYKEK